MDNRRKHTRFAVAIAAELEAGNQTVEAETRDLSEGGVSVMVPDSVAGHAALAEGRTLSLTLILTQDGIEDPHEPPFVGPASVMCSAPTDRGQTQLGLRFVPLSAGARAQLQRFLAKLA
ncbi:MAG TPA: PilZ domain-containing protein [Polyangiales bacterium]|nr:PilZ domain-containing protein [Polyangiales bacterium]